MENSSISNHIQQKKKKEIKRTGSNPLAAKLKSIRTRSNLLETKIVA